MVNAGLIAGIPMGMGMMPIYPILAQVNFGGNWSTFIGIALAGSGVALYALRSMRPKLARDYDIFFAAVALLCGGILFFQGWRQDPILQFGQFLLTGTAIFFAYESIRLRGVATEQARRNTPIVDDERPVSSSYRAEYQAEFDEINPYEERSTPRRIRAARDSRPGREEYEEEDRPRRTSARSRSDDRLSPGSARRKPRPRPEEGPTDYPARDYSSSSDYPERDSTEGDRPSRSRSSSRAGNSTPGSSRSRRSRSTEEGSTARRPRPSESESASSEYVDFRPINTDEEDNWGDY